MNEVYQVESFLFSKKKHFSVRDDKHVIMLVYSSGLVTLSHHGYFGSINTNQLPQPNLPS